MTPEYEDPQDLNQYTYCHNNPLKYTDPTGHFFGAILGAAFTGAIWGAGIYTASVALSNVVNNRPVFQGFSWGQCAKQAAIGAVTGAAIGAVTGVAAQVAKYGFGAVFGNVAKAAPKAKSSGAAGFTSLLGNLVKGGVKKVTNVVGNPFTKALAQPQQTRVFWSGYPTAKAKATQWALDNSAKTLEMTKLGRALDMITGITPKPLRPALNPAWDALSWAWSRGTTGRAVVFFSKSAKITSTWSRIESPNLYSKNVRLLFNFVR